MLSGLGANHWALNDLDQAADCYLRVRQLYHAIGDATGEGAALVDCGAIQHTRRDLSGAVELYTQALDVLQGPEPHGAPAATALMNRGVAHRDLGRPRESYADSHAALALFRTVNDRRNQALLLDNLAEFQLHDGDSTSALDLYRQGLELGRLLSDARIQGQAHAGIGDAHAAAGHDDAAHKAWSEAHLHFEQIDHPEAAVLRQRLGVCTVRLDSPPSPRR